MIDLFVVSLVYCILCQFDNPSLFSKRNIDITPNSRKNIKNKTLRKKNKKLEQKITLQSISGIA